MCHKQRGVPAATMPATCQLGSACLFLGVLAHLPCRKPPHTTWPLQPLPRTSRWRSSSERNWSAEQRVCPFSLAESSGWGGRCTEGGAVSRSGRCIGAGLPLAGLWGRGAGSTARRRVHQKPGAKDPCR